MCMCDHAFFAFIAQPPPYIARSSEPCIITGVVVNKMQVLTTSPQVRTSWTTHTHAGLCSLYTFFILHAL
jgi:hypothetical protein